MQISRRRLLSLAFLLRDEQNRLVRFDSGVDCGKRRRPPDQQWNYDVWKDNDVAKGQYWNSVGRFERLAFALVSLSQAATLPSSAGSARSRGVAGCRS
jgi:hypothetical protein